MARLSHPNVIAVHEVGTVDDEVFLVMELNDGSTLRAVARRGAAAVAARSSRCSPRPARGLAAAHRAGLIHRDFKPDNVLLSRDRRVRVVDFGLVHVPAAGEAPMVPPDGDVAAVAHPRPARCSGTPPYMAPEQHRAEPADPRTDQFSFCVALHEGLYGRRPFLGDTYAELVSNVLDGVISPPPFNRGVPPAVYQVLLRGLGSDRETRYLAMDALLDDLLAFAQLDDRRRSPGAPSRWRAPSQPDLDPATPGASTRRRRSRLPLVASLLLAVALALGVAALLLRGDRDSGPSVAPVPPAAIDAKTGQPAQTKAGQTTGQSSVARTTTGDAATSSTATPPEEPGETFDRVR